MIRTALIGCGSRARDHIEATRRLPGASVVACCSPTAVRREALAREYGLAAYADPAEMLDREKPDLVHLITWPETRVELMTLVADKGVPLCTVEKPIATGVRDWRALRRLAERSATKFAVSHQLRWHPDLVRCRRALREGDLGAPLFLDLTAGMNIAGQGTHILHYGRSLVGDAQVVEVFANAAGWDETDAGHPGPLATETLLTLEGGTRALWTTGTVSPRCGDPATTWQHVRVACHAEAGRTLFEEFGKWEIVGPGGAERGHFGNMKGWRERNIEAQAGFHQAMIDWRADRGPAPGTHLAASLHEWGVVLATYQSALDAVPVRLDSFEPDDDLPMRLRERLSS